MVNQHFLSRLAFAASFFALGVIALGAFTRLIDAGLGCPDWPGCYGNFTVPLSALAERIAKLQYPGTQLVAYKAWAEMMHRYFVAGLSLLITFIVIIILSKKAFRTVVNISLVIGLIALLAYQIMLGQWTVTLKLLPVIVSQHLLGGFFILSLLWLVYLNNSYVNSGRALTRLTKNFLLPLAVIALVLVLLQIALGAWTSTNYASLSCPDFPFCTKGHALVMQFKDAFNIFAPVGVNYEGGVLPEAVRQTIQMSHRYGALIVTVYLLAYMMISMPKLIRFPELMKSVYVMMGLLCVQLCIGVSNVMFKLPLATALSHTVIAALLLLSVLTLIFKLAKADAGVPA